MKTEFFEKGWAVFAPETATLEWAQHALTDAKQALSNPDYSQWYQCENTWFVGLDVLDNDAHGCIAGSAPLSGAAVDFITQTCGGWPALHRGQLSGVFPGYPRPRAGETEVGFRYRAHRDAAHVDGVLGVGTPKRRFVQEPHAFILGVPLTHADRDAAPLVVWEGSHRIMKDAFRAAFAQGQASDMSQTDVTDVYQAARREVFETCPRVIVHAPPGAAIVVHRLALHGVAPWAKGATADPAGRLIAYFRPPIVGGVQAWIDMP